MDAFVAFLNDPTLAIWLNFNTVDNRIVNTLDEMQAMMAAL